ncbi:MAG: YtxH domain-containing protein [Cyanobacteriota bacterium]|nr:YtxH domain-containing protein [Cyanobacteriota bacterium]
MANKATGFLMGGMLVGTAVGAAVGVLFAPRSGRETRRLLKKSAEALPELAEDLSATVQLQTNRLSESAVQNWDETLTRLQDAIAAGVEASQLRAKELERTDEAPLNSSPLNDRW